MLLIRRSRLNCNWPRPKQGHISHLPLILGLQAGGLDDIGAVEELTTNTNSDDWVWEVTPVKNPVCYRDIVSFKIIILVIVPASKFDDRKEMSHTVVHDGRE